MMATTSATTTHRIKPLLGQEQEASTTSSTTMERSSFGAARSVFGAQLKKTSYKRPEPISSSTTSSASSSSKSAEQEPASWRSRLRGSGSSGSHASTHSSALDNIPPSKRIGAAKSPGRSSIRKLHITSVGKEEPAESTTTGLAPTHRVRGRHEPPSPSSSPLRSSLSKKSLLKHNTNDSVESEAAELAKLEAAAAQAAQRQQEQQKPGRVVSKYSGSATAAWRARKAAEKLAQQQEAAAATTTPKESSSSQQSTTVTPTSSPAMPSWRKKHSSSSSSTLPTSPLRTHARQVTPTTPVKDDKVEASNSSSPTTPSWRKKYGSSQRTTNPSSSPQRTYSSPLRKTADMGDEEKRKLPSYLQNKWRKDQQEHQADKSTPPSSPSWRKQHTVSPTRSISSSASSPRSHYSPVKNSPFKTSRRLVGSNGSTYGSPRKHGLPGAPSSPTITTSRKPPSPVLFQSPARRVHNSPRRSNHRRTLNLSSLAAAPRLDDDDNDAEIEVFSITKEASSHNHRRQQPQKAPRAKAAVPSTPRERQAALRVQTCWRRYHQRVRFLWQLKYHRKMLKLQAKLAAVEREKQRELEEIAAIVADYKEQAHAKAQKKKAALQEKSRHNEELERKVAEMKKENAQIQTKNEMLKKNARNLRINNLRLEKSAESSTEYYEQLKLHHDRCVEDNQKLSKVENNYQKKVSELEENLATRTRYANAEHRIRACYRRGILDAVAVGEETNDENLILTLYAIQEGIEEMEKTWKDPEPPSPDSAARRKKFKLTREQLRARHFNKKKQSAVIDIDTSDSSDDLPLKSIPSLKVTSKSTTTRKTGDGDSSSSSSSSSKEKLRKGRTTTKSTPGKTTAQNSNALSDSGSSSSSDDDRPISRRSAIQAQSTRQ